VLRDHLAERIDDISVGQARTAYSRQTRKSVVDDRVPDVQAADGGVEARGLLLAGELRRVHTDDHEAAVVLPFELPQLRQQMEAVNSTERPEVEQHQFAAKVAHAQRPIGVQPLGADWKLWRVHLAANRLGMVRLSPARDQI